MGKENAASKGGGFLSRFKVSPKASPQGSPQAAKNAATPRGPPQSRLPVAPHPAGFTPQPLTARGRPAGGDGAAAAAASGGLLRPLKGSTTNDTTPRNFSTRPLNSARGVPGRQPAARQDGSQTARGGRPAAPASSTYLDALVTPRRGGGSSLLPAPPQSAQRPPPLQAQQPQQPDPAAEQQQRLAAVQQQGRVAAQQQARASHEEQHVQQQIR
jgi:hypothetical protein